MSPSSTSGPIPRARVLLGQLTAAMRASRFYPADHPLVQRLIGELLGTLRTFHAEGDEIKLTFHAGEVILGGTVLTEESMLFDQLARELEALGANSITFRSGVTAEELTRLVLLTAGGPDRVGEQGGLTKALERGGGGQSVLEIELGGKVGPGNGAVEGNRGKSAVE